jgi:hypothetical protein
VPAPVERHVRSHQGLVAQQVKAAADALGVDFGGYKQRSMKEPSAPEEHALDYAEIIAPLVRAVQELADRIERFEARAATVRPAAAPPALRPAARSAGSRRA